MTPVYAVAERAADTSGSSLYVYRMFDTWGVLLCTFTKIKIDRILWMIAIIFCALCVSE